MSETQRILISLRPADYYFFGGENTFGPKTEGRSKEERNYFVRSRKLPQQTALVGVLRHLLFLAGKEVGNSSFQPNYQPSKVADYQTFGVLKSVSSLYLKNGRRLLLPAAKLWHSSAEEVVVDFSTTVGPSVQGMTYQTTFADLPELAFRKAQDEALMPYTEKEKFGEFWVDTESAKLVPAEEIFHSSVHIGIDKANRMELGNDIDAFYKQEYFHLAPGYSFAFVATVSTDIKPELFNRTMPFGGENRTFIMEAIELNETWEKRLDMEGAYGSNSDRIVLPTDCFIPQTKLNELYAACRLVVASVKPFRSIMVPGSPKTNQQRVYYNLHKLKHKELLYLFARGSVLFPKKGEIQTILNLIHSQHNYRNIGYNHTFPHSLNPKSE